MTKDYCPGFVTPATGGVVGFGEDVDLSALRELGEELGIKRARLSRWLDFPYESATTRVWGTIYTCVHKGEVLLQPTEVEEVIMQTPEEVLRRSAAGEQIMPDAVHALELLLEVRQTQSRRIVQALSMLGFVGASYVLPQLFA